jgi:hypothetical protein
MRTTIDIPEAIFRRAKALAAIEGKSLKTFVLEAITRELRERTDQKGRSRRVKIPLVRSKRPGSLYITGDTISEALYDEDMHALARH